MQFWVQSLVTFLCALAFFHTSEPLITYVYNRSDFSRSSFLFSIPYCIAMGVSLLEFIIEVNYFPGVKEYKTIHIIGVLLVIIGEIIRKTAMITAQASFTHLIKHQKRDVHVLITHGIYHYFRHPGYLGWFIWAPSTQLILMNPISFGLFLSWAWYFFYDRIPYEEHFLIHKLFGQQYEDYRARTPSGIPFIK